jgi:hypothetical protein
VQYILGYRFNFKDFLQHSGEKSSIAFSHEKPITFDQQSACQTLHLYDYHELYQDFKKKVMCYNININFN